MKKVIFVLGCAILLALASCTSKKAEGEVAPSDSTAVETVVDTTLVADSTVVATADTTVAE